ncbi:hypothetical protein NDU88_008917 [Pleurodeles waltl]|uniref:Uncharacterized protein n=1 Tax=Pleurodeles waltl TaxID=8319 RepID=A0AAV7N6C7_PLEWA|nr:hypothetical protein NDU88_008917 [Pleurodeles waltl]
MSLLLPAPPPLLWLREASLSQAATSCSARKESELLPDPPPLPWVQATSQLSIIPSPWLHFASPAGKRHLCFRPRPRCHGSRKLPPGPALSPPRRGLD